MGGVVAGIGIAAGLRQIVNSASTLQQINSRLARSTDNLGETQAFLRDTARDLSAEYLTLADSYSRLLPLQAGGLVSLENTRKISVGLANVQAALGVSTSEVALGIRGLVQAMGSGNRVKAEEFNQVFENFPALLQEVNKAAGLTTGAFRRMVLAGEVTADEFVEKYVAGLERFEGSAAAMAGNIAQSFRRVTTEYQLVAENLSEPITSAIVPFADSVAAALRVVANNTDEFVGAIKGVAGAITLAFGARAAGEIADFAKRQVAAAKSVIAIEQSKAQALRTAYAENANVDAQRIASQRALEASESASIASAARVEQARVTGIASKQREVVATANATAETARNTLAEIENSAAIVRRNQAVQLGAIEQAKATALSAKNTQERLVATQRLAEAQLAESQSSARLTELSKSQTVAQAALTKAKAEAGVASRALVQAEIAETQAKTAYGTAAKQSEIAQRASTAAKNAAVASTGALTTAETAATAATLRQTIALRAQAAAAAVSGLAMKGLGTALALVGGPAGLAITAGAAALYFATRQTDAEKAVESLDKALVELNQRYRENIASANAFAESQRKQAEAAVLAQREVVNRLRAENEASSDAGFKAFGSVAIERATAKLEDLEIKLRQFNKQVKVDLGAASTGREFDDLYQKVVEVRDVVEDIGDRQGLLDKILPDDKKLRQLEDLRKELEATFAGDFGSADYKRAAAALSQQISEIGGVVVVEDGRAKKIQESIDAVQRLTESYETQRQQIERRFKTDNNTISLNIRTEENPEGTLSLDGAESLRIKASKARRDGLNRIDEQEAQDRRDADQKLRDIAEQAFQKELEQNAEHRQKMADAQRVNDPGGFEQERYNRELEALKVQNEFKIVNLAEYQSQRLAAITNHLDTVEGIERTASEKRRDAAIGSGLPIEQAEAAHQARLKEIREFGFDIASLRDQYNKGLLSLSEYHAQVEQLEQDHKDKLKNIDKGGFAERFSTEIGFTNQLFDIYEQSLSRKSDRALAAAKADREAADNATGAEKEALEKQAQISEAAAKKRFKEEKRASIAQARVQQGLAVIKAWGGTTGGVYAQIAAAAVAFASTESVIQDIKSQQFNGGSPIGGGGSTGGGSGGTGGSSDQVNGQDINNSAQNVTFNVFTADEIVDQEKLKGKYLQFTQESVNDGTIRNEGGNIMVNHLG